MKYCAVIPARGGSKTIKNKNRVKINGVPLLKYSLMHASFCKKINKIFVTSDDDKILSLCNNYKCEIIKRPKNISNDIATIEEVLHHTISFMKKRKVFPENIILLQPTSPIRFKDDIAKAINYYEKKKLDSLFSHVNFHSLFWRKQGQKKLKAMNYIPKKRQNRQNMSDYLIENGSIYIFKTKLFSKYNSRLFGKIGSYEMKKISIYEIDDLSDIKDFKKILKAYPILKWKKK